MLTKFCDIEILNELKKNDILAFNTRYLQYSKPLYVYLLHKLKDPDLCNDILQDIFISLWEKRAQLKIETSVKAYLYQSARFKIIDKYRQEVKYHKYLSELDSYIIDPATIADRIDQRAQLQQIEKKVKNMPAKMREIFILSRFEHQSTRDIASKTNLSPQTVKNQVSKALRILRFNYMSVDAVILAVVLNLLK
jgi:RNA polymerase sigma-70 factor (family 1)